MGCFMLPWSRRLVRIAVIGDVILDEYWQGNVNRISPEAPVPIHHVQHVSHHPGGAANTALNIQKVGGHAFLFGTWGVDEAANILEKILQTEGISCQGILQVASRPTARKTRITSGPQQMLRIDREQPFPLEVVFQSRILQQLKETEWDAFLLSDYGKGALPYHFVRQLVELAQQRKIPVIVDPKGKDFDRYQGCTLVTPNIKESCVALGLDEEGAYTGEFLGRELQKKFGLHDVLVTMGAMGMIYIPHDLTEIPVREQAKAKEVFDVSGAGDTVAAVMALSLAVQATIEEAVHLATIAAGKVVEKWGTRPILQQELEIGLQEAEIENETDSGSIGKIWIRENLPILLQKSQAQHKKIVFTNGCFDLLHVGHVTYLEQAKKLGDVLVVGVNSDASVQRLKGQKRPINPLQERMRMLAGLQSVDYVVAFDEDTPAMLIEQVQPDVLVKASDYEMHRIVGADFVQARGGTVLCLDFIEGFSSTNMIAKILASEKP